MRSYSFFYNDTSPTNIYTLSLHDALPILLTSMAWIFVLSPNIGWVNALLKSWFGLVEAPSRYWGDRKSTRLNSSHGYISYAVFCLKKKKQINDISFATNYAI